MVLTLQLHACPNKAFENTLFVYSALHDVFLYALFSNNYILVPFPINLCGQHSLDAADLQESASEFDATPNYCQACQSKKLTLTTVSHILLLHSLGHAVQEFLASALALSTVGPLLPASNGIFSHLCNNICWSS